MKRDVIVGRAKATLQVNGEKFEYQRDSGPPCTGSFQSVAVGSGGYLVFINTRVYQVTLTQPGQVSVNRQSFAIEVSDPRNLTGAGAARLQPGSARISAAMPGKVIQVLVAAGDTVAAGQGLLVVEAMKMQNEMKAPQPGRITEVRTEAGATVAAGEILVVIE